MREKASPRPSGAKAKRKPEATRAASSRLIAQKRLSVESHLRMPIAEWRLKKRQEWRSVMSALSVFNYGSAYTPTGNDLFELQRAAERIKEAMAEDWVCW